MVLGVMLALRFAFDRAPPLPARERQRARRNLQCAAKILRSLPREIDAELYTIVELPERDGFPEFELNDPVSKARAAMLAVMQASAGKPPRPKRPGRRFAPTSFAVAELVRIARGSKPDLDRACLTAMAASILGAVMITVNDKRAKPLPDPSWGERVGAALAGEEDALVQPLERTQEPPFLRSE
jgi:hypothetical protein